MRKQDHHHYILGRLAEAFQKGGVQLARQIAVANLSHFKQAHPILFTCHDGNENGLTDVQFMIMKRLAAIKEMAGFGFCTPQCGLTQQALFTMYTCALLVQDYDERIDVAMAKSFDHLPVNEVWTESQIKEFKWDFKFYFHRAILGHVLIANEEASWKDKGDFLKSAVDAAPEVMPAIMVRSLIGRVMRKLPIEKQLFNMVCAAMLGKSFCSCGDAYVDLIVELLCGSSARPFKEYLAIDPLKTPIHVHHLVGLIGIGCLDLNVLVLQLKAMAINYLIIIIYLFL